jgi:hypothetical protein
MATLTERVTVVTATAVEARAARAAIGSRARVLQSGIALRGLRDGAGPIVISCGLAGGLRDDLPTGTVLIPHQVRRPDGSMLTCDPQLVEGLIAAARAAGHEPVSSPLLTTARIVRGSERQRWAAEGYAGADMETGLLHAPRVACVRVILDTPVHEFSAAWGNPALVVFRPDAWLDIPFLARQAPRCAALAARIVAGALP